MSDRSIAQIVRDISADTKALAEEEAALAKQEIKEGSVKLGTAIGLTVVGLGILIMSLFVLTAFFVAIFHEFAGWGWWASTLIVFGIYVVIASILVAIAVPLFKKGNPTPTRASDRGKSVIAAVKTALTNPSGPRV